MRRNLILFSISILLFLVVDLLNKKGIIKNRLNAERATNISSNLILIAFICEIFIFGLLQLLEIKTERRLMR